MNQLTSILAAAVAARMRESRNRGDADRVGTHPAIAKLLDDEKIRENSIGHLLCRLASVTTAITSHIEFSAIRADFRE